MRGFKKINVKAINFINQIIIKITIMINYRKFLSHKLG